MSTASVVPVTSQGESAAVPGLHNFRPAAGAVPGTLYRADSLDGLGPDGVQALSRRGISLAVDMRSAEEAEERPYDLDGLARVAHPVALLEPGVVPARDVTLATLYARLVDVHGTTLTDAVRSLARHDGAALVHCTAGKDRTGVVVALTLLATGVDRDVVVADYAASHANLVGEWTTAYLARRPDLFALPPNLMEALNGSPAPVLEQTLDLIGRTHGGAADYLLAHGLSSDDLDRLHRYAP